VGRRSRARAKTGASGDLSAPASEYSHDHGNSLTLRGSLTLGARREYAETMSGATGSASTTQEDAWQRGVELLFERLAVRWTIEGAPIDRPREMLARFRIATAEERAWVREVLRKHCVEHFPDVHAP
jgi:hypothetical protein